MAKPERILLYRKENGERLFCHVIEHEREHWLVPQWLLGPTEHAKRPIRIICLTRVPFAPPPTPMYGVHQVTDVRFSRDELDGRTLEYYVIEEPDIVFKDTDFDD
jgi:hypothetical protein